MATLDWIDEFFDDEEEAVEDPIAEAADDMDMEFPDLVDAIEDEPLEMPETADPIADAASDGAELDPINDVVTDPVFGDDIDAAGEDPDFGMPANEDEAANFAELTDMQDMLADKSEDMAQTTESMTAPDFGAATEIQDRETQDKKDLTGEPMLVQLAPGTRLTIEGLGEATVEQGTPDVETA